MSRHDEQVAGGAVDERLERKGGSARALYSHWEQHQWSALEIDLRRDAASFDGLRPIERDGLSWNQTEHFGRPSTPA